MTTPPSSPGFRRPPAISRGGRPAFSLLEVVVILAIITIVVGAGAMSLAYLRRDAALRGPARQLSEAVSRAGWAAREQQHPVDLVFSATGFQIDGIDSSPASGPAGNGGDPTPIRVDPVNLAAFDRVSLRLPGAQAWTELGKQPMTIRLDPLAFSPGFSVRLESADLGWVEQDFHGLTGELAEERSSTSKKDRRP